MIFDLHRKPLVGGIETRAFGHRPAFERAIEFESKIVVRTARVMFLDNIQIAFAP